MNRVQRIIQTLRSQAIGLSALFIALGGTGYAALSIPRNSVGTRQLRNAAVTANKLGKGSVTPTKLNGSSIPGYVAFWAQIAGNGQVSASSTPATTTGWSSSPTPGAGGVGVISFHGAVSKKCFPLANVVTGGGYVDVAFQGSAHGTTQVTVTMFTSLVQLQGVPTNELESEPVNVAVICP
jgi:hypothetical protein